MKRSAEKGFTIAEVSIATAVFSVILLIALTIFFAIGRLFYKGVSVSQTQEVAQQIYQDITGNFQGAANVSYNQTGNGYSYHCVGNVRYTYNLDNEVNLDSAPNHAAPDPTNPSQGGNFGILKDTLTGNGSACAAPCDDTHASVICSPPNVKFNNPQELLGQRMRVSQFNVTQSATSPNLYNVSLVIAYGDNDVMDRTNPQNPVCITGARGSEFCSVSRINTSVFRGLNF